MVRLITPIGMLLTVALMAIYSTCAFLIGSIEDSWLLLAGGGLAVVAAYGAALLRPWSQYLVYLLAAGFTVKLGYSIYVGIDSGYFHFQFGALSESLWSLMPSMVITALSLVCCMVVFRHFNGPERSQEATEREDTRGG